MRSFVACGMRTAPGVSFNTAEMVPGVSPKCSATTFRVTRADLLLFLLSIFSFSIRISPSYLYFLQDNEVRKQASRRGISDIGSAAARQQLMYLLLQKRCELSN